VNLRAGSEPGTGSDAASFESAGTIVTPEEPVVLTSGDGCGVSIG
jgi:hypothetical protein